MHVRIVWLLYFTVLLSLHVYISGLQSILVSFPGNLLA